MQRPSLQKVSQRRIALNGHTGRCVDSLLSPSARKSSSLHLKERELQMRTWVRRLDHLCYHLFLGSSVRTQWKRRSYSSKKKRKIWPNKSYRGLEHLSPSSRWLTSRSSLASSSFCWCWCALGSGWCFFMILEPQISFYLNWGIFLCQWSRGGTMLNWLVHHVYHSACLTCAIETSWLFQIWA